MPPELSVARDDAHALQPARLDEIIYVAEVATIGFVATIAARLLGLFGLDALLAIFFSTTLAGQFLASVLGRMRASDRRPAGQGQRE